MRQYLLHQLLLASLRKKGPQQKLQGPLGKKGEKSPSGGRPRRGEKSSFKLGQGGQLFADILTHIHTGEGSVIETGDLEEAKEFLVTVVGGEMLRDQAETGPCF